MPRRRIVELRASESALDDNKATVALHENKNEKAPIEDFPRIRSKIRISACETCEKQACCPIGCRPSKLSIEQCMF